MAEALTCPECGGDRFTVVRPDDDNELLLRCAECPDAAPFLLKPTLSLERLAPPSGRVPRPERPRRPEGGEVEPEPDPRLLSRLRDWRRQQGEREDVPLYMVLPNRTLEALAAAPPTSEAELIEVPGIGEVKLEKYGAELLDILAAHGAEPQPEAPLDEFAEEEEQAP